MASLRQPPFLSPLSERRPALMMEAESEFGSVEAAPLERTPLGPCARVASGCDGRAEQLPELVNVRRTKPL